MNFEKIEELIIATVNGFTEDMINNNPKHVTILAKNYMDLLSKVTTGNITYYLSLIENHKQYTKEHIEAKNEMDVFNAAYGDVQNTSSQRASLSYKIFQIEKHLDSVGRMLQKFHEYKNIALLVKVNMEFFEEAKQKLYNNYTNSVMEGNIELSTKILQAISALDGITRIVDTKFFINDEIKGDKDNG